MLTEEQKAAGVADTMSIPTEVVGQAPTTEEATAFPPVLPSQIIVHARRKCPDCSGKGLATFRYGAGETAPRYQSVCACAQRRFEKAKSDDIVHLPKRRVDTRAGFRHEEFAWKTAAAAKAAESV